MITKRHFVLTFLSILLFYVAGRLAYKLVYKLTLWIVSIFSGNQLIFAGKFPYEFEGDPWFGLVCAAIPVSFVFSYFFIKSRFKKAFKRTVFFYVPCFLVFYLGICYFESFYLTPSDGLINGQPLKYSLRLVDLNLIFITTIILTTITGILISFGRRPGHPKKLAAPAEAVS